MNLRTSLHNTRNSAHINRGSMFLRNGRLISASRISSSASRGCNGKDAGFVLHVLMAHVRKFSVSSFMLAGSRSLFKLAWPSRYRGMREVLMSCKIKSSVHANEGLKFKLRSNLALAGELASWHVGGG